MNGKGLSELAEAMDELDGTIMGLIHARTWLMRRVVDEKKRLGMNALDGMDVEDARVLSRVVAVPSGMPAERLRGVYLALLSETWGLVEEVVSEEG